MSEKKLTTFEGLMAPVFTPYNENNEINFDIIEAYGKQLKDNGISAILVNGTSGEGMLQSVNERKSIAEKWKSVCEKFDILMMVQISGCPFIDAIELAKHAENLNVDGVMCLPDLYFKPKTVQNLVDYVMKISSYCPSIPIYYYHIPMFTSVDLPMAKFMEEAKKQISNFAGIKYTSGDLEKGLPCLKHGQVFLGSDTILCGALALGFTSAIMTSLNIHPEKSMKIIEHIKNGEINKARCEQYGLCTSIEEILQDGGGDWVRSMKKAFNKKFPNIHLGHPRDPL